MSAYNNSIIPAFSELEKEICLSAESLKPLFSPQSIAVIGASRDLHSIGAALLGNLLRFGFRGKIYPVNPSSTELQGLRSFPQVDAIGQSVDLAVIAVPSPLVEQVVRDCAAANVKALVIISSGFAETSEEGKKRQLHITEFIRKNGMRMVGPNCLGVLNTDSHVSLNATFAPIFPPRGNIGFLSQSGALGIAILDYTKAHNIGISTFVSVGNKADVSSNDLLAYWAKDEHTKVIALYLESFGKPRKFARIAPIVARQKPIVAVKSGRSAAGSRAASSHSAALANLDVAVDALFEQTGVIRTNTLEELFDVVALLSTQPLPQGPRVGIITNAGGPAILLADALEAKGLVVPELGSKTIEALRSFLPSQASFKNPVDMIASASPQDFQKTIHLVGADETIDALVIIYIPPLVTESEQIAEAIAISAGMIPVTKPILTVFLSSKGVPPVLNGGPRGNLPAFSFPENAAQALAAAERYTRWKTKPRGQPLVFSDTVQSDLQKIREELLQAKTSPTWLTPNEVSSLLRIIEIQTVTSIETPLAQVEHKAEQLGYPLVLKVISPDVVHKSDVGGVVLGLQSKKEIRRAVTEITTRMTARKLRLAGFLLQQEIHSHIEAFVGISNDPVFGPLVVCGLGGVQVELLRDVSFSLTPVTDIGAGEMIDKLCSKKLLEGFRGAPPGDREALCSIIMRVSSLVEFIPEISEIDLNPIKILPPGQGAIVVDSRIRISP